MWLWPGEPQAQCCVRVRHRLIKSSRCNNYHKWHVDSQPGGITMRCLNRPWSHSCRSSWTMHSHILLDHQTGSPKSIWYIVIYLPDMSPQSICVTLDGTPSPKVGNKSWLHCRKKLDKIQQNSIRSDTLDEFTLFIVLELYRMFERSLFTFCNLHVLLILLSMARCSTNFAL